MSSTLRAGLWRQAAKDFGIGLVICLVVVLLAASDCEAASYNRSATGKPPSTNQELSELAAPTTTSLLWRGTNFSKIRRARLLESEVDVQVSGVIARGIITQRFQLPRWGAEEAAYVLPLTHDGMVDGLRMTIGDRVINGLPGGERHDGQPARGDQRATLARDIAQLDLDAFVAEIPNTSGAQTITVELTFQQLVQQNSDGGFELRLPIGPATARAARLRVHAKLDAGFAVSTVESVDHDAAIEMIGEEKAVVDIDQGWTRAVQDFTLRWSLQPSALPQVALFRETRNQAEHLMALVVPPDPRFAASAPPRDLIFVLDQLKMISALQRRQLMHALEHAVRRLRPTDRFNVFMSSGEWTRRLFNTPQTASTANRALLHRSLGYDRGTQAGGLVAAFREGLQGTTANDEPSRLRQVVVVTDGWSQGTRELLALAAKAPSTHRIFAINAGAGPASLIFRRISELGRGAYFEVSSRTGQHKVVETFLQSLERPVLTDLTIKWPAGVRAEMVPDVLPDLDVSRPQLVLARVSTLRGKLAIEGQYRGNEWVANETLVDGRRGAGIAKLWAARRSVALMYRTLSGQNRSHVVKAVSELSRAYELANGGFAFSATGPGDDIRGSASQEAARAGTNSGMLKSRHNQSDLAVGGKAGPRLALLVSQPISKALGWKAFAPGQQADDRSNKSGAADRADLDATGGLVNGGQSALSWPLLNERHVMMIIVVLLFATMCAITLGFWRHLRHQYASSLRNGRLEGDGFRLDRI